MARFSLSILSIILVGYAFKPSNSTTAIRGTNTELANKMVYLKDYEHFNYLTDHYLLDSCKTDAHGNFNFKLTINKSKLVLIEDHSNAPVTYKLFRSNPELYARSFCANFFTLTPTLFIEPGNDYRITKWNFSNQDESIAFKDKSNNNLRKYYREHDYWRDITNSESGMPLKITPDEAWCFVKEHRDSLINVFHLDSKKDNAEVHNYFRTEIILGAINDYLNWYSEDHFEIDQNFYSDFMNEYNSEFWHPLSFEYFKLTEHYISHKMNQRLDDSLVYHPPSDKKIEIARNHLRHDMIDQYTSNLSELINKSYE